MAHYIQKVALAAIPILFLAGAGAQQQRPFSHKYHLTQVSSCQGCHTDAETSAKADDNILPFHVTACATCHDETHIKEPRKTHVTKFSHAQHVKVNPGPIIAAAIKNGTWLGKESEKPAAVDTKNACVACHHDIEKSEAIKEDDGHKHYPRMADCLTCHNKINPPESCKQCHDSSMTFRPATHTAEFVDAHGVKGKIAKTDCASCHGKNFTCKGCH
jgi:DnaJ-class molecular chaperone